MTFECWMLRKELRILLSFYLELVMRSLIAASLNFLIYLFFCFYIWIRSHLTYFLFSPTSLTWICNDFRLYLRIRMFWLRDWLLLSILASKFFNTSDLRLRSSASTSYWVFYFDVYRSIVLRIFSSSLIAVYCSFLLVFSDKELKPRRILISVALGSTVCAGLVYTFAIINKIIYEEQ